MSLRDGGPSSAADHDVLQRTLDAMPGRVAVLDERAAVIAANHGWYAAAAVTGARIVGAPYAEAVATLGHEDAGVALVLDRAIRAAIADGAEPVELEYASHGTETTRWFSVTVGAFRHRGRPGAMVSHREVFSRGAHDAAPRRGDVHTRRCQARIKTALREDRFELFAQPIVDAASGETLRHELLIRLRGDAGEIVLPCEFLPVAEQCGLIREIDRVVIAKALRLAGAGHAVNLNVSAAALGDPALLGFVDRLLAEHDVRPGLVVFEITETTLVEDEANAERFVRGVADRGCGVALDDFGTGYGGFRYLKRLPVGALKIDREFVTDLELGSADMHVIQAIVRLARGLGLQTIAEGVEDLATVARLRALGVDHVQGFALGRPRPLREVFGDLA